MGNLSFGLVPYIRSLIGHTAGQMAFDVYSTFLFALGGLFVFGSIEVHLGQGRFNLDGVRGESTYQKQSLTGLPVITTETD